MMFPMQCPARSICTLLTLAATVLAARPQRAPAQDWVDRRTSGPFTCRADFQLDQTSGLLKQLAQLQDDLVRYLGIPPAREPIELYLFRDKWSYARFLKRHFPNVPYRRALYIKGGGPGMVLAYRSRDFEIDVRHECTHALLHAVLPVVPLWLDEGLAEYFELPVEKRAFDNPHLKTLRWNVRLGTVAHIKGLEEKGNLLEMHQNEYRYSWAWVHFMLHGPREAHQELVSYLRDLRNNTPAGLLSRRLEQRLPGTQRRLAGHFNAWRR